MPDIFIGISEIVNISSAAYPSILDSNLTRNVKGTTMSQLEADQTTLKTIVDDYADKISRSDAEALASLFTRDGVVMAPDVPTMDGVDQLKAFFTQAFTTIKLDAVIHIDEVNVDGDHAFVRCHSDVQMTLLATSASHLEHNRELFVFRKDSGEWKIARYMFNKMPSA
jgi:uncharacterized protein (TIGR02246 family)